MPRGLGAYVAGVGAYTKNVGAYDEGVSPYRVGLYYDSIRVHPKTEGFYYRGLRVLHKGAVIGVYLDRGRVCDWGLW